MNHVFLGGSRKVSRLTDPIRERLQEIVQRKMHIIIGDANGADKAMQRQLAEWGYPNVVVYFVGLQPRNNEGDWPTYHVATPPRARGFDFYSVKDRVMAEAAECGFMLWDGESRGTLANVERLAEVSKPVAVYFSPGRRFINVLSSSDIGRLLSEKAFAPAPNNSTSGDLQTALELPERTHRRKQRRTA